jgi:hypothetical protein
VVEWARQDRPLIFSQPRLHSALHSLQSSNKPSETNTHRRRSDLPYPTSSSGKLPLPVSITMEEDNNAAVFAKEVTRLWRAWRTIHEMVQDRVQPLASLDGAHALNAAVRC